MKNSVKHTQRITAATLAVALGVAVYLNWEYAKAGGSTAAADGGEVLETAAEPLADEAVTVSDGLMTGKRRWKPPIRITARPSW